MALVATPIKFGTYKTCKKLRRSLMLSVPPPLQVIEAFEKAHPLVENADVDWSMDVTQVLVTCECSSSYRVCVNGRSLASASLPQLKNIACPICKQTNRLVRVSGHSAGYFNASIFTIDNKPISL
jgi:uncharacterized protein YbaR (Trm112 family)